MAVKDMYDDLVSVGSGSFLDIQPPAGTEVVINNIYHAGSVELYRYDGTDTCLFATDAGANLIGFNNMRCKNGHYLRVKNVSGATQVIGYDGVVTKA